jgi:hypothetical protein
MREAVKEVNLNLKGDSTPINLPDCYIKIAEIAFYKAEKRGFEPGHEFDDWIEAELEFREISIKDIH